jgi:hypothetical protein
VIFKNSFLAPKPVAEEASADVDASEDVVDVANHNYENISVTDGQVRH